MARLHSVLTLSPAKIAGIYTLLGMGWIGTSDNLAAWLAQSQADLTVIQTVKGWGFILLSGLLIFGLTVYRERQLETTQSRFRIANQHLHVLHRVLRHNIRNNMNVVTGHLELILENSSDKQLRKYASAALSSTEEFCDMAEKLRVIDEVDPNDPATGPKNIVSIVEPLLRDVQSSYPDVTIDRHLTTVAYVHGGPAMRMIFDELLTNAIDHAERPLEALRIGVTVTTTKDSVRVEISDNGPGIHPDELDALRAGHENQLLHTSGAGLWVVTWLVELFDGEISFDSDRSEGTTVTIEFDRSSPMSYAAETAQNEVPMLAPEGRQF